jgi:hypothetical protein
MKWNEIKWSWNKKKLKKERVVEEWKYKSANKSHLCFIRKPGWNKKNLKRNEVEMNKVEICSWILKKFENEMKLMSFGGRVGIQRCWQKSYLLSQKTKLK